MLRHRRIYDAIPARLASMNSEEVCDRNDKNLKSFAMHMLNFHGPGFFIHSVKKETCTTALGECWTSLAVLIKKHSAKQGDMGMRSIVRRVLGEQEDEIDGGPHVCGESDARDEAAHARSWLEENKLMHPELWKMVRLKTCHNCGEYVKDS